MIARSFLMMCICGMAAAGEISPVLEMHLQRLAKGPIKEVAEWPEMLFSGCKKDMSERIVDKKAHDALVEKVPKKLLKDLKIGKTIEHDGWFLTPVEAKNSELKEPTWILLIASRKGEKDLYFNSVW